MKGTIHCIHTLEDLWIFKIIKDNIPYRFPLILDGLDSNDDGKEVVGQIVMVEGVEWIKIKKD